MNRKYPPVTLSEEECEELHRIIHTGVHASRTIKRARVLVRLYEQQMSHDAIAEECGYRSSKTIYDIAQRYRQGGLQRSLYEAPRPGKEPKFSPEEAARITAIACSEAPDGRLRWTLRLLADRVVELAICDHVAPATIRSVLKKTN
jgi:putative transposase